MRKQSIRSDFYAGWSGGCGNSFRRFRRDCLATFVSSMCCMFVAIGPRSVYAADRADIPRQRLDFKFRSIHFADSTKRFDEAEAVQLHGLFPVTLFWRWRKVWESAFLWGTFLDIAKAFQRICTYSCYRNASRCYEALFWRYRKAKLNKFQRERRIFTKLFVKDSEDDKKGRSEGFCSFPPDRTNVMIGRVFARPSRGARDVL